MKKITKGIRLEPLLINRAEARAATEQLKLSEWVRQLIRRELGFRNELRTGK